MFERMPIIAPVDAAARIIEGAQVKRWRAR
jgi:hypothetical protein